MKTRLTLKPGQNGTKKLQDKYGGRLLAVRYRYDPGRRLRVKTVELIEEELPWELPLLTSAEANAPVFIRIDYAENELRKSVKSAGGVWQPDRKLWRLPYSTVHAMGLEQRMVT